MVPKGSHRMPDGTIMKNKDMPKSKKYRKKPRGYRRKLANAPHLYNRHEPHGIGYIYNRFNPNDPSINAFHQGNRRYQDREKLESLKRIKNREGIQTGLMAENFKKIESAYYSSTATADRITSGLKGIRDDVNNLNRQAPRKEAQVTGNGITFKDATTQKPTTRIDNTYGQGYLDGLSIAFEPSPTAISNVSSTTDDKSSIEQLSAELEVPTSFVAAPSPGTKTPPPSKKTDLRKVGSSERADDSSFVRTASEEVADRNVRNDAPVKAPRVNLSRDERTERTRAEAALRSAMANSLGASPGLSPIQAIPEDRRATMVTPAPPEDRRATMVTPAKREEYSPRTQQQINKRKAFIESAITPSPDVAPRALAYESYESSDAET